MDKINTDIIFSENPPARPSRYLISRFFYEKRLIEFFAELSINGVKDLEDISKCTENEVLEISPLNWNQKRIFRAFVQEGQIQLRSY